MAEHPIGLQQLGDAIHGALELSTRSDGLAPLRLPEWTRVQHADGGLERVSAQTSGVRIMLITTASRITLDATFTRTASPVHPARPFGVVAEVDGLARIATLDEGDVLVEAPDRGAQRRPGSRSRVTFQFAASTVERVITLWLPTSAAVVLHGLSADAPLRAAPPRGPRWTHYGSSISHGSDLEDPRSPWPQQVARTQGLDLVNLGFAGNAMLDAVVARAIAQHPAELISLKMGINIVNGDTMRARAFVPAVHNFLDLVRAGHPSTPLAVITALACPIHEDATGPTREVSPGQAGATPRPIPPGDGSLTLRRTRSLLERVVEIREDPQLHLVDGLALLSAEDGHLPDNLHPDVEGHELIAARFAPVANRLLRRR